MGNVFSTEEISITPRKEYLPLDHATTSEDGRHVYAKFMYDRKHYSPSYILKIEAATNRIVGKVFVSDFLIENMRVSPDGHFLAYQSHSRFVLLDLRTSEVLLRVESQDSSFGFVRKSLFFQKSANTFSQFNLETKEVTDFFSQQNKISRIKHLCFSEDVRIAFFVVLHENTNEHFIAKFDCQAKKIVYLHKSSSRVRALCFSDALGVLLAAKMSGAATIYSVSGSSIKNLKNMKMDESLSSAILSPCGKLLLCSAESDLSMVLYVWNLVERRLVKSYRIYSNGRTSNTENHISTCNSFSLLFFDQEKIILQIENRLSFFGATEPAEKLPKEIYDFGYKAVKNRINALKMKMFFEAKLAEMKAKIRSRKDLGDGPISTEHFAFNFSGLYQKDKTRILEDKHNSEQKKTELAVSEDKHSVDDANEELALSFSDKTVRKKKNIVARKTSIDLDPMEFRVSSNDRRKTQLRLMYSPDTKQRNIGDGGAARNDNGITLCQTCTQKMRSIGEQDLCQECFNQVGRSRYHPNLPKLPRLR
jgi:hypothetical protein